MNHADEISQALHWREEQTTAGPVHRLRSAPLRIEREAPTRPSLIVPIIVAGIVWTIASPAAEIIYDLIAMHLIWSIE